MNEDIQALGLNDVYFNFVSSYKHYFTYISEDGKYQVDVNDYKYTFEPVERGNDLAYCDSVEVTELKPTSTT